MKIKAIIVENKSNHGWKWSNHGIKIKAYMIKIKVNTIKIKISMFKSSKFSLKLKNTNIGKEKLYKFWKWVIEYLYFWRWFGEIASNIIIELKQHNMCWQKTDM